MHAERDHFVIIGAGISGLAAAERLAREPRPPRVTVLEASDRCGGIIATERENGFVIELGPDVLLASKPAALDLASRVGLADRLIPTAIRGSYVVRRGRLMRLPEGISGLVPENRLALLATRLLSPAGRLRAAVEWWIPPAGRPRRGSEAGRQPVSPGHEAPVASHDTESIRDFVLRRFGREVYDRLAEPLLTGVFAGDGTRLSVDAAFPRLRQLELEHGSVLRGLVAQRGAGAPSPGFVSFRSGLGELPEAIARWLRESGGVDLRLQASVASVAASHGAYAVRLARGDPIRADGVIIATPAHTTADLLTSIDGSLAAAFRSVERASTAVVTLAVPTAAVRRSLDGTGWVTPRIEQRPVLACTWSSAKFAGRAPPGFALFRLFLGGVGREEILSGDDASLVRLARAELADILGVVAEPVLTRVTRWHGAMPQYTVGHLARVAAIERGLAAYPRLSVAGNALTGVGIPDCVRSGQLAAERLLRR